MGDKYGPKVTMRLLPDKAQVYEEFKDLVDNKLHSDVCYVLTMLLESFTSAVNAGPDANQPVIMNFLKQNVQINMGCTFQYYTKKARRAAPQDLTQITTDRHNLLPEVVNQYTNTKEQSRKFWFDVFQDQGLIPRTVKDPFTVRRRRSPVITGKAKRHKSFFSKVYHTIVRQLSAVFRGRGKPAKRRG